MIRVCPERDAACPHGMECVYWIDRYRCSDKPQRGLGITQRDDGGPAFPQKREIGDFFTGMSLRDWFAGHVVAYTAPYFNIELGDDRIKQAAEYSYRMADAMLAERIKP